MLPDQAFVSLAEALSWIAFGDALTFDDLRAQVEGNRRPSINSPEQRLRWFFAGDDNDAPDVPGRGHFEDRQSGLARLTEAWRQLRDEVDRGAVKVRGRYTAKYSLADACLAMVEDLNGDLLAEFSQFDISTGGIQHQPHGSPEVIYNYHPQAVDRGYGAGGDDWRKADGFLMVEVERAGLLRNQTSSEEGRAPSVKAGRPPNDEDILAKADEMKSWGLDGRTIAKTMRLEKGFENVANTEVRRVIKGRWPSGRAGKKLAS